ncbi:hypothetical protein ACFVVM_32900 [Nocardia sp. NPDC058176]|uniref:hypothetical protein n=1 Tax=Nocardia sp. NPDC058176 TaxID=3346368 RepID=UPI0036DB727D
MSAALVLPDESESDDGEYAARTARSRAFGSVLAPEPWECAPVWDGPVPGSGRRPAGWLLGAHGGAGVSTLAQMMAPLGDCHRRWPLGRGGESPLVVIVVRETIPGLVQAHSLLRQYHCGMAGPGARLLGMISVANRPGRSSRSIRRYLDLVQQLVPEQGRWQLDWQDEWPQTKITELPTWQPRSQAPEKGTDPLRAIRPLAEELFTVIRSEFDIIKEGTPR